MASNSIIDLEKCIDKDVRVKFQGGREGEAPADPSLSALSSLVRVLCVSSPPSRSARRPQGLRPAREHRPRRLRRVHARRARPASRCRAERGLDATPPARARADPDDPYRLTDKTRKLGLVVCRGLQVSLVSPVDGMEEIANPFIQHAEG